MPSNTLKLYYYNAVILTLKKKWFFLVYRFVYDHFRWVASLRCTLRPRPSMRPFIAIKEYEKISNCIIFFFVVVCGFGPARIESLNNSVKELQNIFI